MITIRPRPARGSRLLLPLLAAALLAAAPEPARTQTPIAAGTAWGGGTELVSAPAGIAFALPDGFQAEWDADLLAVLMGAQGGEVLAAVWGWSEGTAEEVEAVIGERLAAAGIQASLRGEPEIEENEARAYYDVMTPEGRGLLRGVIRVGEHGNVVAVAALGGPDAQAAVTNVTDRILGSVRMEAPGAAAWRDEVSGTVLTTGSSSSNYSPGGAGGGGSSASQSTSTLQLCGGRQYAYQTESESYISIEGMSASSNSSDGHQGAWYVVSDLVGTPTLVLEANDGRVFHWSVAEHGNDVIVDGTAYGVSGGC